MLQSETLSTNQADKMPAVLKSSFHCAVWPLVLGLSFLLGAFLTRVEIFGFFGLLFIPVGITVNLAGLTNLARFRYENQSNKELLTRWNNLIWACFVVLLLNYPAAIVCYLLGDALFFPFGD